MKHTLELHYSVVNGGDGSAYPHFFESAELAEWDQDHQCEGWGESCTGTIVLESDSPIKVTSPTISTKHEVFSEMVEDDRDEEEIQEFVEKFYPEGVPTFGIRQRGKDKNVYELLLGEEVVNAWIYSTDPDELLERINAYGHQRI